MAKMKCLRTNVANMASKIENVKKFSLLITVCTLHHAPKTPKSKPIFSGSEGASDGGKRGLRTED